MLIACTWAHFLGALSEPHGGRGVSVSWTMVGLQPGRHVLQLQPSIPDPQGASAPVEDQVLQTLAALVAQVGDICRSPVG